MCGGGSGRAGKAGVIESTVVGGMQPEVEPGAHAAAREQFAGVSWEARLSKAPVETSHGFPPHLTEAWLCSQPHSPEALEEGLKPLQKKANMRASTWGRNSSWPSLWGPETALFSLALPGPHSVRAEKKKTPRDSNFLTRQTFLKTTLGGAHK